MDLKVNEHKEEIYTKPWVNWKKLNEEVFGSVHTGMK